MERGIRRRGLLAVDIDREAYMAQQSDAGRLRGGGGGAGPIAAPEITVRLGGALLALAVATAHVADQGGVTAFTTPDWRGWAYRLIEVGGVLTALALSWPRLAKLGWAAGVLLGLAPFLGYIASRTVGVPGDPGDVGNWGDWVGTLALVVEAGLVTVSVGMVWAFWRRSSPVAVPATADAELNGVGLSHGGEALRPGTVR
jgi:hypothetical protein